MTLGAPCWSAAAELSYIAYDHEHLFQIGKHNLDFFLWCISAKFHWIFNSEYGFMTINQCISISWLKNTKQWLGVINGHLNSKKFNYECFSQITFRLVPYYISNPKYYCGQKQGEILFNRENSPIKRLSHFLLLWFIITIVVIIFYNISSSCI